MKPPDKERTFLTVAVIGLAAILIHLGILQYRWSGEISRAASERIQANLQKSMSTFRDRLTREIVDIGIALQPEREIVSDEGAAQYSRRFLQWQRSATNGRLVKAIYVAERHSAGAPLQLFRLNPGTQKFEATDWPSDFGNLRQVMDHLSDALPFLHPGLQRGAGAHPGMPVHDQAWGFDQAVPALLRPIDDSPALANKGPSRVRWLILQLDQTFLDQQVMPELARAQFAVSGQFDFKVAVVGGSEEHPIVIYSSEPGFGANPQQHFAGRLNLWGTPPRSDHSGPPATEREMPAELIRSGEPHGPAHLLVLHLSPADREWELVVNPRNGSLEASVANLRRRNLAVSLGILVILAGTIAAVMLTTARAQNLAALQMEFVTGVTHELRTPLAVILSASENIKDGVVSKPPQLARYGEMIHRQAKQLMQLVEQVLLFASSRQAQLKFELVPTEVIPVIETALETAKDSGVTLDRRFEPDLPLVMADPGALTQCLQNLIANAVKYGGAEHWIGVEARKHIEDGRGEVCITVEDHGIGIHRSELPHIFRPFYRSPAVSASNVHGTGLGLSLSKGMIEAMSGRITVETQPGRGSAFTVHLPVSPRLGVTGSEPREESDTRIPHV